MGGNVIERLNDLIAFNWLTQKCIQEKTIVAFWAILSMISAFWGPGNVNSLIV